MKLKGIILAAGCAFFLTACTSENVQESVSAETSAAESVSDRTEAPTDETTAENTTLETTAAEETTEEQTAPAEVSAEELSVEVPENASYKKTTVSYNENGVCTGRNISFYDGYDNIILNLHQTNPESDQLSRMEYTYEYNADGTIAYKEYKAMPGDVHVDYEYSDGLLVKEITYYNGEWFGTLTHTLNEHGHPVKTEYEYASEGGFGGLSEYEYEYDENGRVIRQETENKSTAYYSSVSYTYDEKGNLKSEDDGSRRKFYTYDSENQVVKLECYYIGSLSWYEEYEYTEFQ